MDPGTIITISSVITKSIGVLQSVDRYIKDRKAAQQAQLNLEQTHHLSGIGHILPQILKGHEFSPDFINLLIEYTDSTIQWRSTQRLKKRYEEILIPVFRGNGSIKIGNDMPGVRITANIIETLIGFLEDPDIVIIAPSEYPKGVPPMSIPNLILPKRFGDRQGEAATERWNDMFALESKKSSPFRIKATSRLSAWNQLKVAKSTKREVGDYNNTMNAKGASRVDIDLERRQKMDARGGSRLGVDPDWGVYYGNMKKAKECLLPTEVESCFISSIGEVSEEARQSFAKLACLYGEILLAEEAATAQVGLLEQQLSEAGIATEDLNEYSDRVSIFYGSCADKSILQSKLKVSEAIDKGKLPIPVDLSAGLGFESPTEFSIQRVVSEIKSIISANYVEWINQTLHELKHTVEKMSLSTDNDPDKLK